MRGRSRMMLVAAVAAALLLEGYSCTESSRAINLAGGVGGAAGSWADWGVGGADEEGASSKARKLLFGRRMGTRRTRRGDDGAGEGEKEAGEGEEGEGEGGGGGAMSGAAAGTSTADVRPPDSCKIIFAAFYAIKPGGYNRRKGQRCNGCHSSPAHITFESARLTHPGACTAIITDVNSDFSKQKGLEGVQIYRYAEVNPDSIGTENLMYERMKGYRAFLAQAAKEAWGKNIVMLDTDVVIIGDVNDLFKGNYDYGLTARANPDMPVNGGVQFARGDSAAKAVDFLTHVIAVWDKMSQGSRRGGYAFTGDQRAYGQAIGNVKGMFALAAKKGGGVVTSTAGHKVLIMPGTQYNRTPGGGGAALKRANVKILHYKGGRKEKMYVPFNAMKKGGAAAVFKLKSTN